MMLPKVIVMSATVDVGKLQNYFRGICKCGVVRASGRLHNAQNKFWKPAIPMLMIESDISLITSNLGSQTEAFRGIALH